MARVISSTVRARRPRLFSTQVSVTTENFNKTRTGIETLRRAMSRSRLGTLVSRQRFAHQLVAGVFGRRPVLPAIQQAVTTAAGEIVQSERWHPYTLCHHGTISRRSPRRL